MNLYFVMQHTFVILCQNDRFLLAVR